MEHVNIDKIVLKSLTSFLVQKRVLSILSATKIMMVLVSYKNNGIVTPLSCSDKMSGYEKKLMIKDEKLLTKYNEIWSKTKSIIRRKKFGCDLVFVDSI